MIKKIKTIIKDIFVRNRYVEAQTHQFNFNSKIYLQVTVSFAFLVLSVANVISASYIMLVFTTVGCVINAVCAFLAKKYYNGKICAYSSLITCSLLFGFFVIYGGNDGFACLWVVLLPLLAMVIMDFVWGLCASALFQVFLIVMFWTPAQKFLLYSYSEQFRLRFPLFFFITFLLGFLLTVSLYKSQYNEYKHLSELEKMTEVAHDLARIDPLTQLANRRRAYEEFNSKYTEKGVPHCVVMGDIDFFKNINDTYGHEFGDEVLVVMAKYMRELLPETYLKSRWGGEEFLFAANESLETVFKEIERLRVALSEHVFDYKNIKISVTVTFGIAEYSSNGLDEAIIVADRRLYLGKAASKNCTVIKG